MLTNCSSNSLCILPEQEVFKGRHSHTSSYHTAQSCETSHHVFHWRAILGLCWELKGNFGIFKTRAPFSLHSSGSDWPPGTENFWNQSIRSPQTQPRNVLHVGPSLPTVLVLFHSDSYFLLPDIIMEQTPLTETKMLPRRMQGLLVKPDHC